MRWPPAPVSGLAVDLAFRKPEQAEPSGRALLAPALVVPEWEEALGQASPSVWLGVPLESAGPGPG